MTRTTRKHRCRRQQDLRAENRLLCSDLVKVRWTTPEGERREEIAILEDVSKGGASLFLGVPVSESQPVVVSAGDDNRFAGLVRYCRTAPNGYLVGIHFTHERCASAGAYTPEHLLDVSRLDFDQ